MRYVGKIEKAKERLKTIPNDYTYSEAKALLIHLGFKEFNKGKTSGSRVRFFRSKDKAVINLHKPHPGNQMSIASVRDLYEYLNDLGELK